MDLSVEFQRKVLATLVGDPTFFCSVEPYLREDVFETPILKQLYKLTKKSYHQFNVSPSKEYFLQEVSKLVKRNNSSTLLPLLSQELSKVLDVPHDREWVKRSFEDFLQRSALRETTNFLAQNLETGDLDQIRSKLYRALSISHSDGFEGTHVFSNPKSRHTQRVNFGTTRVPTLVPGVDGLIGGGLSPKELGMVLGLSGTGKSICLANIAKGAIQQKLPTVYYTLEMSEEKVSTRLESLFSGINYDELWEPSNQVLGKLEEVADQVGDRLVVKQFPTRGAKVLTLKFHLEHLQRSGFDPKVVIVDYAGLMSPKHRYSNTYEELGSICEDLRGLAVEKGLVMWTAAQANRKAVGANRVREDHIADSFRGFHTVDVMVSLTQNEMERRNNRMRISALKVRDKRRGGFATVGTRFERMRFTQNP